MDIMAGNGTYPHSFFELTIPGHVEYLDLVMMSIRETVRRCGFDVPDMDMLLLGAEEAFTNMTKHAYAGEESQSVKIACRISNGRFFLSFHDRGIPFDGSIAGTFVPPSNRAISDIQAGGIGLFLINRIFDEVRWVNHGRSGKELRLTKNWGIAEPESLGLRLTQGTAPDLSLKDPLRHSFRVRLFEAGDALKLSRLFYRIYGYSLEYEIMFYPDRLIEFINSGNFVSAVCVDEASSEIVGHLGFIMNPENRVAEASFSAISPEYREYGILTSIVKFLTETAIGKGVAGLSANVALYHQFSQKIALREGYTPCAILLGYYPENHVFIDSEAGPPGSRSPALLMFRHLVPPAPVDLHMPARHSDIIRAVYDSLGSGFNLPETTDVVLQHGHMTANMNRRYRTSKIIVSLVGKDTKTEINRAKKDLCEVGQAEVVYLCLPLNQPKTQALCADCENMGFFFSGIEPMPGGISDMLRLQYLNTKIDFPTLPVYDELSKRLLDHIREEFKRIHG